MAMGNFFRLGDRQKLRIGGIYNGNQTADQLTGQKAGTQTVHNRDITAARRTAPATNSGQVAIPRKVTTLKIHQTDSYKEALW